MSEYAPLALFVSYPFCKRKCSFCPRPVCSAPASTRRRYVDALLRELEASSKAAIGQEVCAIRIGGGQTSQASTGELADLTECIVSNYSLSPKAEVTLKVLPEPAVGKIAGEWNDLGFNRIDYSVVTTDSSTRKLLGMPQLDANFGQPSGIENFGVSLSFGLPGQDSPALDAEIAAMLALGTKHIALKPFKLAANTPLGELYKKHLGKYEACSKRGIPTNEQTATMLNAAKNTLKGLGMVEYLPLRFALPGYECQFDGAIATGADVLGFGCNSRSRFRGIHFENTEFLDVYIANSPDFDKITSEFSIL